VATIKLREQEQAYKAHLVSISTKIHSKDETAGSPPGPRAHAEQHAMPQAVRRRGAPRPERHLSCIYKITRQLAKQVSRPDSIRRPDPGRSYGGRKLADPTRLGATSSPLGRSRAPAQRLRLCDAEAKQACQLVAPRCHLREPCLSVSVPRQALQGARSRPECRHEKRRVWARRARGRRARAAPCSGWPLPSGWRQPARAWPLPRGSPRPRPAADARAKQR